MLEYSERKRGHIDKQEKRKKIRKRKEDKIKEKKSSSETIVAVTFKPTKMSALWKFQDQIGSENLVSRY